MRFIIQLLFLSLTVSCAPSPIDLYPLLHDESDDDTDFVIPNPPPAPDPVEKGPQVLRYETNEFENVVVEFSKPVREISTFRYNHELLTESWSENRMTLTLTFIKPLVETRTLESVTLLGIRDDEGEWNSRGAVILINMKNAE